MARERVFRLEITMENDAFRQGGGARELARVLKVAGEKFREGKDAGRLVDANGNTVGRFTIEDEEQA